MRFGSLVGRLERAEREARRRVAVEPGPPEWFEAALKLATVSELRELRDAIEAGTFTLDHPTVAALGARVESGERPPPEPSFPSAGRGKRPANPQLPVLGSGADGSAAQRTVDAQPAAEPEEPVRVDEGEPTEPVERWHPEPEFAPAAFTWRAQGSREDGTLAHRVGIDPKRIF